MSLSTMGLIFFIAGLILLVLTIIFTMRDWHLSQVCTQPSSARIVNVRYEPAYDEDDSDEWIATIQYTADRGLEYTKPDALKAYKEGEYQIGDEIAIRYNPSNPSEYVVGRGPFDLRPYALFGGVDLAVLVLPYSIVQIVRFRRRRAAVRLAARREKNLQAAQSPWDSSQENPRD